MDFTDEQKPVARNARGSSAKLKEGFKEGRHVAGLAKIAIAAVIAIIVLTNLPFGIVPAGHRGVVTQLGAVTGEVKKEGLYVKIPLIQKVHLMEVRIIKFETDATAASKDLQSVSSIIALNFHLDAKNVDNLFQDVGPEYEQRIIAPAIQEAFKMTTAKFTAEQLITKRSEAKESAKEVLTKRLIKQGIIVDDLNIVNFQFSKQFDQAIEAKVTAEQEALAAKNKLERVKYEAQQRIEEAKGKAEAIRIESDALKSNPSIMQLRAVEKWNGELPKVTGGATPFINID